MPLYTHFQFTFLQLVESERQQARKKLKDKHSSKNYKELKTCRRITFRGSNVDTNRLHLRSPPLDLYQHYFSREEIHLRLFIDLK
jgi:hypothetical protein